MGVRSELYRDPGGGRRAEAMTMVITPSVAGYAPRADRHVFTMDEPRQRR